MGRPTARRSPRIASRRSRRATTSNGPTVSAERLDVAERTVKTYRARAIEKLGFSSRAEITAYVRRVGLDEE